MEAKLTKENKRYVYGTRDEKWHLVDESDRDFEHGLTPEEFKKLGEEEAKKRYLRPRGLKGGQDV